MGVFHQRRYRDAWFDGTAGWRFTCWYRRFRQRVVRGRQHLTPRKGASFDFTRDCTKLAFWKPRTLPENRREVEASRWPAKHVLVLGERRVFQHCVTRSNRLRHFETEPMSLTAAVSGSPRLEFLRTLARREYSSGNSSRFTESRRLPSPNQARLLIPLPPK